ncbi:MAG TPA: bifunctional diaminohydroxyphosphoribosylaminopyrimidine deaminase/5-amino-6-(5-phosphoribosylamino)uracil reductase RibD [Candidatus Hydrogenedentes bacterium]|nr:bifunctional diaminohydroxyphosphoribosylaminopyrimidine deaminase/5-amino-6-(5-phosphoribosylamino)uracil reductase RibD [Candidatus Hydrogenedentota bacterium]
MSTDITHMRRALALAAKGRGRTSPNHMVGCVIVRDGQLIGEGYHVRAGEPHAEVNAIAAAGGDIAGATVYVTLEPCAHQGKTPPCVNVLIEKKPSRVVVAVEDPNPQVSGKGIAALREAGISVDVGVLENDARTLNEAFFKYITTGRPFVIAKCAMTLDGKIATRTGHSRWVTSDESRRMVHELRNEVDALLVGSRTVMLDDPSLTTRLDRQGTRDPVRVILDAGEYLDAGRRVFHLDSQAPTWVAVTEPRQYPFASDIIRVPRGKGGVDIEALMDELGKRGITYLLIEGGGTTHASAFEAGVVDKVWIFIAPKIIGGRDAITPVEGEGVATMDEAIELTNMQVRPIGPDLLVEAYVKKHHVYGNY